MPSMVAACLQERSFIFGSFGVGILATLGCLLSAAWVLMEPEVAAVASCLICSTVYLVISEARRIQKRFHLEEEEVVSFAELSRMFPQCADQTASASCTSRSSTAGMGTPISCQRGGAAAAASTPGSAGGMQFIPSSGKLA